MSNKDCVVVLGCGPVGLMAIMASLGTARVVIAVDGIESRRAVAESLGAISVEPGAPRDIVDRCTRGVGADVVIEAPGSAPALDASFGLARPQGVVSVVGAHFEPDYPLNNAVMFEKELSLVFSIGNPSQDRERLFSAIEAGALSGFNRSLQHFDEGVKRCQYGIGRNVSASIGGICPLQGDRQ